MSQDIYIVIEHLRGQVAEISYVMLAAGHELAKGTGGKVVAVLLGHNLSGLSSSARRGREHYFWKIDQDSILWISYIESVSIRGGMQNLCLQ